MKNILLRSFQILAILILGFLALSTFLPLRTDPGFLFLNNFYHSPLNLALWLLLVLILVLTILFKGIRRKRQMVLHITLAVMIVLFIVDKSNNERFFITIPEGKSVNLCEHIDKQDELYNKSIHLDRFEIDLHEDEESPKAYRSHLRLDDEIKTLEVNKPLAIGKYRLYQSSFDQRFYFSLKVDDEEFELSFGDSIKTGKGLIILDNYDERIRHFRLLVDDTVYWLPHDTELTLDGIKWSIVPLEKRYRSIIEVVEVRGLIWLLIAGMVYLFNIAYGFWGPGKSKEEK